MSTPPAKLTAAGTFPSVVSPPAAAACYADTAGYFTAGIVAHRRIAQNTYRIRLDCPIIASLALPGQFAMVRIPDRNDPLLARPLAVYDTFSTASHAVLESDSASRRYADFIYAVHGKFTTALKEIPVGRELILWGPLGNGFGAIPPIDHLILVAGGIGQTALLALGKERLGVCRYGSPSHPIPKLAKRVTLCWGARQADVFGDVEDFHTAGMDVHLATLDGSTGRHGTVVDLLNDLFGSSTGANEAINSGSTSVHVACCGPEGMMAAVAQWTSERQMPCSVSLEAPMACGIGICFTCVAKVRSADGSWDYRRTCIEGPVFDARAIEW